jgi:hypothetical protein
MSKCHTSCPNGSYHERRIVVREGHRVQRAASSVRRQRDNFCEGRVQLEESCFFQIW